MAPKEPVPAPFRWEFIPMEEARDRSVRWRWRAYSHNGDVAMESRASFETLTECMNDARREGYAR